MPDLGCFDGFTASFIRSRARKLIGKAGFRPSDLYDLIQEFALDLVQRRPRYDPRKGTWEAFVIVVCENRAASLLAHRRAAMRTPEREERSLNCAPSQGRCPESLSDVSEAQHRQRTGQRFWTHEEAVDFQLDVAQALNPLPPEARTLCQGLMAGSISEVARQRGVSRQSLYRQVAPIRRQFENAGLSLYV